MSDPRNVLFLCTGNSARSILAEALLNERAIGGGRFRGYSAGSQPRGTVHPLALDTLKEHGLPTAGLRSKSWHEFSGPDAPRMDFIFTVCDNAAGEQCPVWPGHPATAHWSFEDPAAFKGPDIEKRRFFEKIFQEISARIRLFLALPLDKIDRMSLLNELNKIGKTSPA